MTRFFCPGRMELAGNHTYMQRGRVMAAALDVGVAAEAEPNDDGVIRVFSRGFDPIEVELSRPWPDEKEQGSSAALVRGMAGEIGQCVSGLRGFDAYVFNDLKPGQGLSSSSAFTVLIGFILATFSGAQIDPEELARMVQRVESRWYGKPCGLSDPLPCAMGGVVYVDLLENKVVPIQCDFESLGLVMCLTDTGGSESQAAPEYAQISEDMAEVARFFGEPFLARVRGPVFNEQWPQHQDDPKWMRARHFFDETWRVASMADALGLRDGGRYMELMNQSGRSSEMLLRNARNDTCGDGLIWGLETSGQILDGKGAWRVHSGGFAGYVQALMPEECFETYKAAMDELFGPGACRRVRISARGVRVAQDEKLLFSRPEDSRGFPEAAADLLDGN